MFTSFFKNIIAITFLFAFAACNNNDKDDALFKSTCESLTASNNQIRHDVLNIFSTMHQRLDLPESVEKAKYYMPLMESINNHSKKIIDEIDSFKFHVNDKSKASLLYQHLKDYRLKMLTLDTLLNQEVQEKYIVVSNDFDSLKQTEKEFWDIFFDGVSKSKSNLILTTFQNNIWNIELNMLHYYLVKSEINFCGYFDSYTFIISQNRTHVKPKENIEIVAGMGAFTKQFNPKVYSSNKLFENSPDGSFNFSFTASQKFGKHIIPVKIDYVDRNGKNQTTIKDVVYYVDSCK